MPSKRQLHDCKGRSGLSYCSASRSYRKMRTNFASKLQWILLLNPTPQAAFMTDQNLIEAPDIPEPRLQCEGIMLQQYTWARKAYPQYHIAMYILCYLCVVPEGPSVERAWCAMDALFSSELGEESALGFGSKATVYSWL